MPLTCRVRQTPSDFPSSAEESKLTRVLALNTDSPALDLVGGKARSLARLVSAGFDVPNGFVISTDAYRGFVERHGLDARIVELAVPEVVGGQLVFERASQELRRLFVSCPMCGDLVADLASMIDAYDGLGDSVPAAVRSSANAEDLPGLSFAGQHETYLNVRGREGLLGAVRACWASLWTPQAMDYRHRMGVPQDSVAMAVVVQEMVPAESAGVLFTANPVTGERSEIVVNANLGLGESVVSGQITPDAFIVERESLAIRETVVGSKAFKIVGDGAKGTRRVDSTSAERNTPALSGEAVTALAEMALQVEALNEGTPQDIEWAFRHGAVWLLQSRPMTNLPPPPIKDVRWDPPPPVHKLLRRQVVEMMPEPLSPLFEDLYFEGQEIGNRLYQEDLDFPIRIDGPWYVTVNGFDYNRGDPTLRARRSGEGAQAVWPKLCKRLGWWRMQTLGKASFGGFLNGVGQVARWRRRVLRQYLATIDEWREVDPGAASADRLFAGVRALTIADAVYWARGTSKVFGVAKIADQTLHNFLRARSSLTSGAFLTGFDTMTMRSNRALWTIARAIRSDGRAYEVVVRTHESDLLDALRNHSEGRDVAKSLAAYLETYGHQVHNLDYVVPTQREDPTALMVNLKSMVLDERYDPDARLAEVQKRRRDAMREARSRIRGLDYLRFRWLLFVAGYFYPSREETAFYMGKAWPVLRPLALELGRRLAAAGAIEGADDIFFLGAREIEDDVGALGRDESLSDRSAVVGERRELREARKRLHPPSVIPPEAADELRHRAAAKANQDDSSTLEGFAVSPGIVTGRVSVIRSPDEFANMLPDTILVCPMTTPAWTQLFSRAIGLVTDIGGITAHGSIVAREYGIPAVLGTDNITERVKSGDTITVDGSTGTVAIHHQDLRA